MPKESSISVGDKFGRLEVIKKLPKDEYDSRSIKRTLFLCKCQCGNEKIVDAGNLKKNVKSCGCLASENAKLQGHKQRTIEGFLNNYWGEYRRQARNRVRDFELSLDEFRVLVTSNCHYCGQHPILRKTKNVVGIPIPINGIDRVDSSIGYLISNVVPCCEVCNKMKLNYDSNEFINKCIQVTLHNMSNGTQLEHVDVAQKCKKAILEHFPFLDCVWSNE